MHSRVHRASLELIKVLAQQTQALICWVISVKPETSIAGMVVSAMEVLYTTDGLSHRKLQTDKHAGDCHQ